MLYRLAEKIFSIIPGCLLNRYTGFYCPACGGSRAVLAFLNGKFLLSFLYHPIVDVTAVLALYKLCHEILFFIAVKKAGHASTAIDDVRKKTDITFTRYLFIAVVVTGAQWIIKNGMHLWLMNM